ncbi:cyclophilin-like fold protein [Microbacterium sp. NPDC058062]|uniref:cyclophilin-like fold protein n=1 Tax=Microbacterium sp. NPDC058062 TaxID=3346320 RepID=UPI0036DB7370
MPQLSLLTLAPQRLLNSVVAALLLLTAPALSQGSPSPAPQAVLAVDDSTTAAQFGALLPFTLTFHDRMGTAVFAQVPTFLAPDSTDPMNEYRAGDVAYVTSDQSIVVFLTDGSAVPDHGLILLGHLTQGLDDLVDCRQDCPVELTADPIGSDTTG